jgi:hypothetical protein
MVDDADFPFSGCVGMQLSYFNEANDPYLGPRSVSLFSNVRQLPFACRSKGVLWLILSHILLFVRLTLDLHHFLSSQHRPQVHFPSS